MGLFDKIFGSKNQKVLKKIQPLVNSINSLEEEYSLLTDEDLLSVLMMRSQAKSQRTSVAAQETHQEEQPIIDEVMVEEPEAGQ